MTTTSHPIKRALLSVSDKTGIESLAKALSELNIDIISSGGTAKVLREAGIAVREVSEVTQFPEMMAGRVKTLHPNIHGGILARRGIDDEVLAEHGIGAIDLVVVNLYPFERTVSAPDCNLENAIENIDIGGPAMVRAAAKNHASVAVVVDPNDYPNLIDGLKQNAQTTSLSERYRLACKAFAHTASYDAAIANYLSSRDETNQAELFPEFLSLNWQKKSDLRYGENPHQQAAYYVDPRSSSASIANAEQLQGKPLSFNNLNDSETALQAVKSFTAPACVIVKHANPCGVASAESLSEAYASAFACDSTSAFGGIIAFNRRLEADLADKILAQQFVEVILAPEVSADALSVFANKPNIRVLSLGQWQQSEDSFAIQQIEGGLLVQQADIHQLQLEDLNVVSERKPSKEELSDLHFAWQVAKYVKSNAIVYAKNNATVGIGAGQMSRVDSAKIAELKAKAGGLSIEQAVMASDAFFPFRDSIDVAAKAGISAIIQPGGSIRDDEVIKAANEHGLAMVFTGIRHFRH